MYVKYKRETRNAYKILVRKPEEEKRLGRFGHKWKHNIKTKLKKTI
jgi:hypothetical protein